MGVEVGPENKLLDFRTYFNNHRTHASLEANAGYNRVTTSSQSRLVSMATTLSILIPNTSRRLICQRLALWCPVNFCKNLA